MSGVQPTTPTAASVLGVAQLGTMVLGSDGGPVVLLSPVEPGLSSPSQDLGLSNPAQGLGDSNPM